MIVFIALAFICESVFDMLNYISLIDHQPMELNYPTCDVFHSVHCG